MQRSGLLLLDGVANVLLGAMLLTVPMRLATLLGFPNMTGGFFASLLGAVLIGIGAALLLERYQGRGDGLGLTGALIINLCFGLALIGWLLVGGLQLPPRGMLLLWAVALVLILLGGIEFVSLQKSHAPEGRSDRLGEAL